MRDAGSDVGRYLGGLDGVRGAACLAVVGAHSIGHFAPTSTPNGVPQILAQGLTVFFVMSGMLIYLPFAREIAAEPGEEIRVRVGRYARRRLMRIFPIYVAVFLVCNFVLGAGFVRNAVESARPFTDAGTGRITEPGDVALQLSLLQTFFPSQLQRGISPAWSLTTELTFYVALPLVALTVASARRRRGGSGWCWAMVPPLLFVVTGLIGRAVVTHMYASSGLTIDLAEFGAHRISVLARSLFVYADSFGFGMALAVLFAGMERRQWPRWTSVRATVVGCALAGIGTAGAVLMLYLQHWYLSTFTGLAAVGLLLLVSDPVARGDETWVSRAAEFLPLRYVGEISYSVYLWHFPMIVLVSRLGWFHTDALTTLASAYVLVATASIALGSLTFRWIERPAMIWASKQRAPIG